MMELLLLDGDRSGAVLLIPQLAPAGLDALARALLEAASFGRRRLLPGPAQDAPTQAVRSWHRDAWTALPATDQRAIAVAAGPGVASLADLIEGAEVAGHGP